MQVILVSGDTDLYKMCREILTEFPGLEWNLQKVTAEECPRNADCYIWDNLARIDPLDSASRFSKHLFLVPRSAVAKFQEKTGCVEAAIVLKPVTRACLAAFLALAASPFQRIASA